MKTRKALKHQPGPVLSVVIIKPRLCYYSGENRPGDGHRQRKNVQRSVKGCQTDRSTLKTSCVLTSVKVKSLENSLSVSEWKRRLLEYFGCSQVCSVLGLAAQLTPLVRDHG